jgi:hypothetical protein
MVVFALAIGPLFWHACVVAGGVAGTHTSPCHPAEPVEPCHDAEAAPEVNVCCIDTASSVVAKQAVVHAPDESGPAVTALLTDVIIFPEQPVRPAVARAHAAGPPAPPRLNVLLCTFLC